MFTVARHRSRTGQARRSTLHPYGLVSRHGKPTTLGYYVLHEGLIGVLGDQGLQEYTYDNVDKEPRFPASRPSGKAWNGVSGGFVGITDKYWAAAVVARSGAALSGQLHDAPGRRRPRSIRRTCSARPATVAPGASARGDEPPLRRRQGGRDRRRLRGRARHQELRPPDRLGLVLLHHQAALQAARLLLSACSAISASRS